MTRPVSAPMPAPRPARSLVTAMVCAAAVTGQFIGGKATRDALFLTSMDFTALPAMLIATSAWSMVLVALHARGARRFAPRVFVPASLVASGVLFVCEWLLRSTSPAVTATAVYLHVSGAGPLLTSGFWLISSERFDPHTAKRRFGQIAAAGTLGGLLSALAAERVAAMFGVPAMLPLLAVLQFASAWLVWRLAADAPPTPQPHIASHPIADRRSQVGNQPIANRRSQRSGLRVVAETPYLRHLSALVLLGTTGAALVDYLFKAQAVETFGRGDHLLRFFAIYYAATSLITFLLQIASSRAVLERFGLGVTTGTPSSALLIGSIASLFAPGFGSLLVARGGESVFRSSLYRAGYELFYTPMPAADKRAAKSWIDVALDRAGDALGGGLVRACVLLFPAVQSPAILWLAAICSAGALVAAGRLNRGYVGTLATSLVHRAGDMDVAAAAESGTTRLLMQSILMRRADPAAGVRTHQAAAPAVLDADVQDVVSLRSRDRDRIVEVLAREEGLTAALVPHVIPLLAWEPVSDHALFALRKVAEERVGQLVDALLDPNQDFAIRRRLARVFSVCVSDRAANGLMFGLDDPRFDVRCQSARSLAAIVEKNPRIAIDSQRIFDVVLREVAVGRRVWEGRRSLDTLPSASPLDQFVRDRAGESLAHVFTLLSLVLPREPLQIAFRSLHTDDQQLQGTALEYLDSILPAPIKRGLWPYLERTPMTRPVRPREEILADLLRSHQSIVLNLEELRRHEIPRTASPNAAPQLA